ncbi:hypothetical protein TREVI0001_1680 [Treponema vincentii ATCC 35580]|uniref:Uncharacterized protein n=1 Tax=Treponema vincentii ATCC 35580 TaxID=596324 RepID=C8PNW1_9SPIR|nr:hypothetical protein TREVI0001_1680 [Treponema vincentii ATCC 35580]
MEPSYDKNRQNDAVFENFRYGTSILTAAYFPILIILYHFAWHIGSIFPT